MTDKPYLEQPELHTKAPFRAAQLTYPGNFREALRQAAEDPTKTLFGVGHGIPSIALTKVLASTRPDFIWIDVEHAMFDRLALHDAIHAAQHHSEGQTMVVVRIPKHDEVTLTTALDSGASGVVIPHVESAQDVKDFIKKIYYPPIGNRSISPWIFTPGITDASLYKEDAVNIKSSNRHIAIIPQIESVKGVENAEEIAAVEGVSGLMFGPGDFMADAGMTVQMGGTTDPEFFAAMEKFSMAAKKYGRPLFGGAMNPEMIPMLIQQGFRAIAVLFDVWGIANMVKGSLTQAKEYAKQAQ